MTTSYTYHRRHAAGFCRNPKCSNPPVDGMYYCEPCNVESNQRSADHRQKFRREVFNQYGGCVCAGCGETDMFVLSLDHELQDKSLYPPGGRAGGGRVLWRWLKKNGWPPGFRVLCMNCQFRARNHAPLPKEQVMERDNIFAYTAPGCHYPEYISINAEGGVLEIIVRSAASADGTCGPTASIKLSSAQEQELLRALYRKQGIPGPCEP